MASALASSVSAQSVDNTGTLPDAKPGECYAKVITPAKFTTRSEVIVTEEASERIESIAAVFEPAEERIVTRESSSVIKATPATFESATEKVRERERELIWTEGSGKSQRPASPGAVDGIAASGLDLAAIDPGSCFVEYWTEAEYRTELQRVLVKEGSSRIEVTPAVFETAEERVVVKEASTEVVDVPAVFRTEEQSVLVEPARSVWKPGRGPVERIDDATGEILCLIELPARYETVMRTVLETPATSKTVNIPAVHETVEVQKLVSPASERRIDIDPEYTTVETYRKVGDAAFLWLAKGADAAEGARTSGREVCLTERPAEYKNVDRQIVAEDASTEVTAVPAEHRTLKVQRLKVDAGEKRIALPQKTETVSRQVEIEPSRLEWRPVLCETNMTSEIVRSLQLALANEGFKPGAPDGVVGAGTMNAIEAYQTKQGLDRGGITYETLRALEVDTP